MDQGTQPAARSLPTKIETLEFIGSKVGNRTVLFAKQDALIHRPFTLTISGEGEQKILIADVQTGDWLITSPNGNQRIKNVEQTLYFSAKAGEYVLVPELGGK